MTQKTRVIEQVLGEVFCKGKRQDNVVVND
jgi:hypothetical protein